MMRSNLFSFAILLFLLPVLAVAGQAGNDFACSLVRGSADLRVDGSLSEWNSRIAAQPLRWSKNLPTDTSTANARCLADNRFLYLGVAVSANPVRFDNVPFSQAWRNDAVEVFVSSQGGSSSSHLRAGLIRVSSDSFGRTVTEGSASVTDGTHATRRFSYPLLWEALGVETGLQVAPTGYTVEIAIPRDVIGWGQSGAVPDLSINVRVRRSCGEKPCQAVIELADDPNNSSPISDERYWSVSFGRQLSAKTVAAPASEDKSVRALMYGALLRLDALDPDGGVALLQGSQDRRLLPVMGSALMAAGRSEASIATLGGLSQGAPEDAVRLWAVEQMALCHSLLGASAVAQGEYATLVGTGDRAYQDVGVAGLIDLALDEGRGDAAISAYRATFGSVAPGIRSASRIADWLRKQGRGSEAIEVLTRLSESGWAQDSERAWALFRLQSIYAQSGNTEKAVAAGWQLQTISPPGNPSGAAGLNLLIANTVSGRITSRSPSSFSESYRKFLDVSPQATDPAREMAYAAALQLEHKPDAAAAIYEKVANEAGALRADRAAAMLALQLLHLESGEFEQSVQTAMTIHESFPEDLASRMASWRLMRLAYATNGMPNALRQPAEDLGRRFIEDLRSSAQGSSDSLKRRAQALLRQFTKEAN